MANEIYFLDYDGNEWWEDINKRTYEIILNNRTVTNHRQLQRIEVHADVNRTIKIHELYVDTIQFHYPVDKILITPTIIKHLKIDSCRRLTILYCYYLESVEFKRNSDSLSIGCSNCPKLGKLPELPNCRNLSCDKQHFDLRKHYNIPEIRLAY